jgi:hypothetical protein
MVAYFYIGRSSSMRDNVFLRAFYVRNAQFARTETEKVEESLTLSFITLLHFVLLHYNAVGTEYKL